MNTELQKKLAGLPKAGQVFIGRDSNLLDENWTIYQDNELAYWQKSYASGYCPEYQESFQRTLSRFGIEANYFSGRKVLEIGCGPQGFSASLVQSAENPPQLHVIVDSLLDKYQDFPTFSLFGKDTIKIAAFGESMPVPDNFFDIVFCQNVLDHVNKPQKVINEISRTLVKGGVALISVHIVPAALKLFGPILSKMDKNHPHHFTYKYVSYLFSEFQIKYAHTVPLHKDITNFSEVSSSRLKVLAAGIILRTLYLKLVKV